MSIFDDIHLKLIQMKIDRLKRKYPNLSISDDNNDDNATVMGYDELDEFEQAIVDNNFDEVQL